jgi:hypothetical protein
MSKPFAHLDRCDFDHAPFLKAGDGRSLPSVLSL